MYLVAYSVTVCANIPIFIYFNSLTYSVMYIETYIETYSATYSATYSVTSDTWRPKYRGARTRHR